MLKPVTLASTDDDGFVKIWRLQLSTGRKLAIVGVFGLGAL